MRHHASRFLAATLLAVVACSSPEEKLVDRRQELRALLDRLHDEYAGEAGRTGRKGDAGPEEAGIFGRLATSMERSHFDQYCLAVGNGERPFTPRARLESFMRDGDHTRKCRAAARLQAQIEKLEREVAGGTARDH